MHKFNPQTERDAIRAHVYDDDYNYTDLKDLAIEALDYIEEFKTMIGQVQGTIADLQGSIADLQ